MELFDTHCHLDAEAFDVDRDAVIERARAAGVTRLVCIGASAGVASARRAVDLATKHPSIWATAGLHPHDADDTTGLETLQELAAHPRVVGIGETGLDYHYSFAQHENQKRWFRDQIRLARAVRKPIVIHCRNAAEDTIRILIEEEAREVGGVFHCYGENAEFARRLFEINFIVSFPGILTFKKSVEMRDTARSIPLEKILLETDAPFLAPEPFRGKRCESAFMVHTAAVLAELHGRSVEQVAAITTANALRFFRIKE